MQRKRHTPDLKAKVALEALKGTKIINEITSEMGIHATQITQWKNKPRKESKSQEPLVEQLYQNIGRLQVELEWLKKNLELPLESKRMLIEPEHPDSIMRQREYWGLTAAVSIMNT